MRAFAEVRDRTGLAEPSRGGKRRREEQGSAEGGAGDIECLLEIFDLHKLSRAETYRKVLDVAKQRLMREVVDRGGSPADDIPMLTELLRVSFPYIGVPELRDVPLCVLARLAALHNRRVRAHRAQLEGERKQRDQEAMHAFLDSARRTGAAAAGAAAAGKSRGAGRTLISSSQRLTKESASLAKKKEAFRLHVEQRDALMRYHNDSMRDMLSVSSMYSTAITIPIRPREAAGGGGGRAGRGGGLSVSGRNDVNIPLSLITQLVDDAPDEVWDAVPPIVKQQIFFELPRDRLRRKVWPLIRRSLRPLERRNLRCAFDLAVVNLNDAGLVRAGEGDFDAAFAIAPKFSMHRFRNGGCAHFSALVELLVGGEAQRGPAAGAAAGDWSRRQLAAALTDRSDLQIVPMYRLIIDTLNKAWFDHRATDADKSMLKKAKVSPSHAHSLAHSLTRSLTHSLARSLPPSHMRRCPGSARACAATGG